MNEGRKSLERLNRLFQAGELTAAEFEILRKRVLAELAKAPSDPVPESPPSPVSTESPRSHFSTQSSFTALLIGTVAGFFVGHLFFIKRELAEKSTPPYVAIVPFPDVKTPALPHKPGEARSVLEKESKETEALLAAAKARYAEGDYLASRTTCEALLQKDSNSEEAKLCAQNANKQIYRKVKDFFTRGYIAERTKRPADATYYFEQASKYVRPGDEYYSRVTEKLKTPSEGLSVPEP